MNEAFSELTPECGDKAQSALVGDNKFYNFLIFIFPLFILAGLFFYCAPGYKSIVVYPHLSNIRYALLITGSALIPSLYYGLALAGFCAAAYRSFRLFRKSYAGTVKDLMVIFCLAGQFCALEAILKIAKTESITNCFGGNFYYF